MFQQLYHGQISFHFICRPFNTVCFVLLVAKWSWLWKKFLEDWPIIYILIFFMQFVFILIGWIVVLFRWFIAVIYFPKDVRSLFHMEDFWTRSIVDMKKDLDAHLISGLFRGKRNLERTPLESIIVNLITTFRLHYLLFMMVFSLQKNFSFTEQNLLVFIETCILNDQAFHNEPRKQFPIVWLERISTKY